MQHGSMEESAPEGESDFVRLVGRTAFLVARGGLGAVLALACAVLAVGFVSALAWFGGAGPLALPTALLLVASAIVLFHAAPMAAFSLAAGEETPRLGDAVKLAGRSLPAVIQNGFKPTFIALSFQAFGALIALCVLAPTAPLAVRVVCGSLAIPYLVVGSGVHGEALVVVAKSIRDGPGPSMRVGAWCLGRPGRAHPCLFFLPGALPLLVATATLGQLVFIASGWAPAFMSVVATTREVIVLVNVAALGLTVLSNAALGVAAVSIAFPREAFNSENGSREQRA